MKIWHLPKGLVATAGLIGLGAVLVGPQSAHASLIGTTIDVFSNVGGSGGFTGNDTNVPFALDGQSIPNVPDFQFGAIAEYSWQAFGSNEATIRGDWSFQDDRIIFPNDPANDIPLDSFHLFGLRAALEADNWTVALFVKNLFDEDDAAFDGINSAQDPRGIVTARPRTIGVQLQYRMGAR